MVVVIQMTAAMIKVAAPIAIAILIAVLVLPIQVVLMMVHPEAPQVVLVLLTLVQVVALLVEVIRVEARAVALREAQEMEAVLRARLDQVEAQAEELLRQVIILKDQEE